MKAFVNGDFIDQENATVHISDLALQRGYGIFEFFKVRGGAPLFIEDYLDRFLRSAQRMQLPLAYSRIELKDIVVKLLELNGATDCGVKFLLTGGYSTDAYHIARPNFIAVQYPIVLNDVISSGIKVITHEHTREIPDVKSINYITGIYTLKKMEEAGAEDVLYHQNGIVTEFPRCNVFIITKDGVIRTPEKNVLAGITRKKIIEIASAHHDVEIGNVTLSDIWSAAEVFLSSTTKRIVPIIRIDTNTIGDGNVGAISKSLFDKLIRLEEDEVSIQSKVRLY